MSLCSSRRRRRRRLLLSDYYSLPLPSPRRRRFDLSCSYVAPSFHPFGGRASEQVSQSVRQSLHDGDVRLTDPLRLGVDGSLLTRSRLAFLRSRVWSFLVLVVVPSIRFPPRRASSSLLRSRVRAGRGGKATHLCDFPNFIVFSFSCFPPASHPPAIFARARARTATTVTLPSCTCAFVRSFSLSYYLRFMVVASR